MLQSGSFTTPVKAEMQEAGSELQEIVAAAFAQSLLTSQQESRLHQLLKDVSCSEADCNALEVLLTALINGTIRRQQELLDEKIRAAILKKCATAAN
jgi:hypothetical protein